MNWEEIMIQICEFYEYEIKQNNGKIRISNFDNNTYVYNSAEELVNDWKNICKTINKDYTENGLEKHFKWL